jgi:hypothetical protein
MPEKYDVPSKSLSEREIKRLSAGIKEFDLKSPVFDPSFLPDELVETGLPNHRRAVRGPRRGKPVLETQVAQSWVVFRAAAERPVIFPMRFQNG